MLHIGIIPDGNRRFARKNNIKTLEGYQLGFKKIKLLINEIYKKNINKKDIITIIRKEQSNINEIKNINNDDKDEIIDNINKHDTINEITLYICSIDNITKRKKHDILDLMSVMYDCINEWSDKNSLIYELEIQVNIVGNINLLPDNKLINKIRNIEKETKKHNKYFLNLAIGYDGKQDIINAINKFNSDKSNKNKNITSLDITNNMIVKRDIDIVIRTGYEKRISGFFPWQTLYSEWFFLDKYCPEIDIFDINKVLNEYSNRERRFGK